MQVSLIFLNYLWRALSRFKDFHKTISLTLSGRRYYYCVIERENISINAEKVGASQTHFISKWKAKPSSWHLFFSLIVLSKRITDMSSYNDDLEFLRVNETGFESQLFFLLAMWLSKQTIETLYNIVFWHVNWGDNWVFRLIKIKWDNICTTLNTNQNLNINSSIVIRKPVFCYYFL